MGRERKVLGSGKRVYAGLARGSEDWDDGRIG